MRIWHWAALAGTCFLAAVPEGLDSCGIAPPSPVYSVSQGPANLEGEFLKGKLGVFQRTFQQRYLIGAFRIMKGVPLTDAEAASLYPVPAKTHVSPEQTPGYDSWNQIRAAFNTPPADGSPSPYRMYTSRGFLFELTNCHEDAYAKATETLLDLVHRWGEKDSRTAQWMKAQNIVFNNCEAGTAIPDAPTQEMDPLLAAHRRYQIGAAYLYSGQGRKAAEVFQQIAAEKDSPWRAIAPYLVVRSLLRAGMAGDLDAYRQGRARGEAILKDPAMGDWHDATQGLLNLWKLRVEPLPRLAELSDHLAQANDEDINQSVIDLLYLVNHRTYGGDKPWTAAEVTEAESGSELAAWLLAMSEQPPSDAGERSMYWWQRKHDAAWLIAALMNSPESDDAELQAAAHQISADSAAYEAASYYAAYRAWAHGHKTEAWKWANDALSRNLLLSTRNMFLDIKNASAPNWTEFLLSSLRTPEPNVVSFEGWEVADFPDRVQIPPQPSLSGSVLFDLEKFVPLSLWMDATRNKALPKYAQLQLAQVGWLRAVVLQRNEEARKLMERIVELQPGAAEVARGYLSAKDPEEARFAVVFILLREPNLQSGLLSAPPTADLGTQHYVASDAYGYMLCWDYRERPGSPPSGNYSGFLSEKLRAEGAAEWKKIRAAVPWDPGFLGQETMNWSAKHPDDPRVPEALHRVVLSAFFRCGDASKGKYSRMAFELLHKQYPKSPWTARTPYWYN